MNWISQGVLDHESIRREHPASSFVKKVPLLFWLDISPYYAVYAQTQTIHSCKYKFVIFPRMLVVFGICSG